MATRTETLALEVTSQVADAVAGLGSVETAAQGATREVANLTSAAGDTSAKLDAVSGSADGLDSASGAATGALGALASGFELVGATGAAETLQNAALATDFLSGVGQSAALAVQAQGAATKVLTVAQKAANAAMRANPIGLVVTAVLLLVGGLILAYNKSETFRAVVQRAGAVAKAAFVSVSDAVSDVVTWVRVRVPPAFEAIRDKVGKFLEPPKAAIGAVVDVIKDVAKFAGDVPAKFGAMRDKAQEIGAAILSPFTAVRDAVQAIIDKIAAIKLPDLPFSGGGGSDFAGDSRVALPTTTTTPAATTTINITVEGALDPYAVAVQIQALLARYGLAVGV